MYDNQKEIDKINEEIKSINPKLELSSFGINGNTVISVGLTIPVKGNSELIKKLENIGFKKIFANIRNQNRLIQDMQAEGIKDIQCIKK